MFSVDHDLSPYGVSVIDPNDYPNVKADYVITDPDFPTDDGLENMTPEAIRVRLLRFIGRRDMDRHQGITTR